MTDDTFTPDAAASGATRDATRDATLGAAPPADDVYAPPWLCTATSPLAATLDAHVDTPVWPTTGPGKTARTPRLPPPTPPRRKRGSVDLLIATPPTRLTPIRPGTNPRSNQQLVDRLDSDLLTTLNACQPLLCPGGTVVFVTGVIRRAGQLLDLTYPIDIAAHCAGLQLVD